MLLFGVYCPSEVLSFWFKQLKVLDTGTQRTQRSAGCEERGLLQPQNKEKYLVMPSYHIFLRANITAETKKTILGGLLANAKGSDLFQEITI